MSGTYKVTEAAQGAGMNKTDSTFRRKVAKPLHWQRRLALQGGGRAW